MPRLFKPLKNKIDKRYFLINNDYQLQKRGISHDPQIRHQTNDLADDATRENIFGQIMPVGTAQRREPRWTGKNYTFHRIQNAKIA